MKSYDWVAEVADINKISTTICSVQYKMMTLYMVGVIKIIVAPTVFLPKKSTLTNGKEN